MSLTLPRIACVLAAILSLGHLAARAQDDEVTLERIFPEKSPFGPSARSAEFSHDGRYAAVLYRPFDERRHGSDLWIFDSNRRELRRVTSVSVMSEFQESTRKVREDRIEKAKKKLDDEDESDVGTDQRELMERGDWVDEEDADAEDAPRYGGVSSLTWSPDAHELLFTSAGDVYRYQVSDDSITRLTRTRDSLRSVRYLPDGSGFTYMADDALMRVQFDSHLVEQIDPALPSGARMAGYRLSPDGRKLAILAYRGTRRNEAGQQVTIVNYRDRFAETREYTRHMADDPWPDYYEAVYMYHMGDGLQETGTLELALEKKTTGPRDILSLPRWAPDSSQAVFAYFEQSTAQVTVFTAPAPVSEEPGDEEDEDSDDEEDEEDEDEEEDASDEETEEEKEPSARPVYRFLHYGGPNTPRMIEPDFAWDSRHIVLLSEQTGFRHLYLLDPLYEALRPLTQGNFEVYRLDMTDDHRTLFVSTTGDHPARLTLHRIDLESGEMTALTREPGRYSNVAVSPDARHVLANFEAYGRLEELVHVDVSSGRMTDLTDSHTELARELTQDQPEYFSYTNRHGHEIYGHLFKPDGWSPRDQRPLLVYVYGGPLGTRKMILDGSYSADAYFFAWYMAKKHGYVTCAIDPRGVSGYGAVFEKASFEQVGKPQVEDLVDGVRHLIAEYGVDAERVAIHGWSFGGFQTQMCMYTEPEVFAAGIAGAGPTEWENYNSWYTTGTIGTSREGQTDLEAFSLLPLAKNLEGHLLLVHGMEDSNVLYQDTVKVYRELLKAGKETLVELFLDPTGGHGLGGDVKRLAKYRKYEEFLLRTVGSASD